MLPMIWDPFRTLAQVENRMDDLFGNLAKFNPALTWSPSIEVSQDDKGITVRAELPGIDPKDISLTIEDHHMSLKGEKKSEKKDKDENDHWTERFYGTFSRTFHLPENIEKEKIKARLKNGILEVTLPKRAEAKPKKIPVQMN